MADQIYNLTQTGAEVQAIINDANNAKGAGATTSLSTDYIMLKDTSGQYHKIQKDSFTEAVRNTLASLLVNNDKGTTISQIAAIASGDFGSVTPANLASVLGADGYVKGLLKVVNEQNYSSLDDIEGGTILSIGASSSKGSLPSNGRCTVITTGWSSARKQQTFIDHQTGLIYVREYINTAWQSWRTSESTLLSDSTRLASLASALGVYMMPTSSTEENLNLNTLNIGGIMGFRSKVSSGSSASELNYPVNCNEVYGVTIGRDPYVCFQLCVDGTNKELYYRSKWSVGDSWGSWKKFTTT